MISFFFTLEKPDYKKYEGTNFIFVNDCKNMYRAIDECERLNIDYLISFGDSPDSAAVALYIVMKKLPHMKFFHIHGKNRTDKLYAYSILKEAGYKEVLLFSSKNFDIIQEENK